MRNFFLDLGVWDAILYALAIGCTVLVVAQRFEIEKEKKRQETPTATVRPCVPTPLAESESIKRVPGVAILTPLLPKERPAKRHPKPKSDPPPTTAPKPLAPVLPTSPEPVAPSPQRPSVPAPQPPPPPAPHDDDDDDDERDHHQLEKERKNLDDEVDRGKEH